MIDAATERQRLDCHGRSSNNEMKTRNKGLSMNNYPILLALLSLFCVAYMDVGQEREQGAEALQQELHNAAMRSLLRLE